METYEQEKDKQSSDKGPYIFKNEGDDLFLESIKIEFDKLSRDSYPNNRISIIDEKEYLLRLKKLNISPVEKLIGKVKQDSNKFHFEIYDPTVVLSSKNKKFKRRSIFKVRDSVNLKKFESIKTPYVFDELSYTNVPLTGALFDSMREHLEDFSNLVHADRSETSAFTLVFKSSIGGIDLAFRYTANCPYNTNYNDVKLIFEDYEIHYINEEAYILLTTVIDFSKIRLSGLIFRYKKEEVLERFPGISMKEFLSYSLENDEEFLPFMIDALNLYNILDEQMIDDPSLLARGIIFNKMEYVWSLIKLGADTSTTLAMRADTSEEIKISYVDVATQFGHYEMLPLFLYNETDYAFIGGNGRYPLLTAIIKNEEEESINREETLNFFKKLFFNNDELQMAAYSEMFDNDM